MITKREKLQYVYVFLTDLAALAASVILAWLIVGGIMGQLLPYSVLDWVQALVLLVLAYTVTFFCFDQTENIVKRTRGQEAKLSIKSNLLMMVIYSAFLTLSKAVLQDSRYFLVGVVSFNLFLLPAAHGLLKKLLVKAPDSLQNETLVGIVTTGDHAGKMIREISNDWSRRVCGVALLEATGDAIGTKVENIEIKANYDTFMNWLRRAALDEVYIDVPMDSGESFIPYLEEMESMGLTVHFRLPLLLRVSNQRVEPLPESEYSAPLRFQLADFAPRDNFVWIDRCYKMGQLWSPELALSTDWCVSQGQLGGEQKVQHVDKPQWQGKTAFRDTLIDMERYKGNVDTLKVVDNDIRYKADSFVFNVAGAPEEVKQFSGISRPESWGRWSNAQLGSDVKIEYKEPLPEKFDLVITAKAYGPNANKPIPVRVGQSEQVLTLVNDVTTTTLHFDNPTRSNTLTITPPDPQSTNEGNILGHSPRQLGIGMVEIKVVKSEG